MILSADTKLDATTRYLPDGIEIRKDGITIDGNGAILVGNNRTGSGIALRNLKNVTLKNLTIAEYHNGIVAIDCENLTIEEVTVRSTGDIAHNTIFLDIFHEPAVYPAGIRLSNVNQASIKNCELSHQFCGLQAYDCQNLKISGNNANYSSGFGFYLSNTSDSEFEDNFADYCCRWHPRDNGNGHMGADAAGFVIVNGATRNIFRKNYARLGGDGFFLAGLRHDGRFAPCNDNTFIQNDASWSPNISFEATFSSGNVFRENIAANSNYGFWLGFSRNNRVERNQIFNNRQAGIAVENGIDMVAEGNRLTGNGHGILLWSKRIPQFDAAVPDNDTSRNWQIERNTFSGNGTAVRIAADQDHGVRPFLNNGKTPPPKNHRLVNNSFDRNNKDIVTEGVEE